MIHRDGRRTKLYMARIIKRNKENNINLSTGDYIGFELLNDSQITQDGRITDENIIQEIILRYEKEQQYGKDEYCVGIIDSQNNRDTKASKTTVNKFKSLVIEEKNFVNEEYRKANAAKNNRNLKEGGEKNQTLADPGTGNNIAGTNYSEPNVGNNIREQRRQRKENPTLTDTGINKNIDGKNYSIYQGVDVNTGNYLNLLVNKVGKNASGTYLFAVYINKGTKEINPENIQKIEPTGKYVVFSSEKRLAEIIKEGNVNAIDSILNMLTYAQYETGGIYIGHIDEKGEQCKDYDPGNAINYKVKELEMEYIKKLEKRRNPGNNSYGDER